MPDPKTGEFRGNRNLKRLRRISQKKQEEEIKRTLELVNCWAGGTVDLDHGW